MSAEQVERLYDQRVACGWRAEEVPEYVEAAKQGNKIFYWVVCIPTTNQYSICKKVTSSALD